MGDFVATRLVLEYGLPTRRGYIDDPGLSFDWRFDPDTNGQWGHHGTEYVEPLGALGPQGQIVPFDCTVVPSGYWRNAIYGAYRPRGFIEYGNGAVGDAGAILDASGDLTAYGDPYNLAFTICRMKPPKDQTVPVCTVLSLACTWLEDPDNPADALLSLVWSQATEDDTWYPYKGLFLHVMSTYHDAGWAYGTPYDVLTEGAILKHWSSGGIASGSTEKPAFEEWRVEFAEDQVQETAGASEERAVATGWWLLARGMDDPDTWYDCFLPYISAPASDHLYVTCRGAIQAFNISPLAYRTCWADAPTTFAVPSGYATGTGWYIYHLASTGWTPTINELGAGDVHQPQVVLTHAGVAYERPLVWWVGEAHDTVVVAGNEVMPYTTDGTYGVAAIEWEVDATGWGQRGTVDFVELDNDAVKYTNIVPNGCANLAVGWDANADAAFQVAQVARGYFPVDQFARGRDGDVAYGAPQLDVDVTAFDGARLEGHREVDFWRQAGGRTVDEWVEDLAERLGLDTSYVYVDATVGAAVIPPNQPLPSKPNFDTVPGDGWASHIRDVCQAVRWETDPGPPPTYAGGMRLLWGCQVGGTWYDLAVVGPPPTYGDTGDLDWEIDASFNYLNYPLAGNACILWDVRHLSGTRDFRNALLSEIGDDEFTTYWSFVENKAIRNAAGGLGDVWTRVISDRNAVNHTAAYQQFLDENYTFADGLAFSCQLCPAMYPDQFIRVLGAGNIKFTANSIYQVVSVKHQAEADCGALEEAVTYVECKHVA